MTSKPIPAIVLTMKQLPFVYDGYNEPITIDLILEWFKQGQKINMIKALRYARNPAQNDGLKDCKDAIDNCHTPQDVLNVFGIVPNEETDAALKKRITNALPILFEHYKDFGFKNVLSAIRFQLDSIENKDWQS